MACGRGGSDHIQRQEMSACGEDRVALGHAKLSTLKFCRLNWNFPDQTVPKGQELRNKVCLARVLVKQMWPISTRKILPHKRFYGRKWFPSEHTQFVFH